MTATNVNANDDVTRVATPVTPTSTEQEAKEAASAGPAPFVATETSLAEDSTDRQQINQTEQKQTSSTTATRPDDLERKPSRLAALKTTKEHWLQKETQIIPKNNLPLCFAGLMLCVALSALDQTIVSTALPTIAFDLNANGAGYTFVGSAYLLGACVSVPFWGRLSDLVGRKPLLFLAIGIFLFGSGMCAAAQNIIWLCTCRGVQGIGGGAIISLVQVVTSDIVPLNKRAGYMGLFGATWGVASVIGPLIGGALTEYTALSWRWAFLINLPIGAIAAAVLFFLLKLNPIEKRSFRSVLREFDWIGYLLLTAASVLFIFGFAEAEINGFNNATVIALIVVGGCFFPAPILWGFFVEKHYPHILPILPPRLFRTRTTSLILLTVILHGIVFFAYTYFLPVYFQSIRGASATFSGVLIFPYALIGSLVSMITGKIVVVIKSWRPVFWYGWVLSVIGYALMTRITAETSLAEIEVFSGIAGLGYGALFQVPLLGLISAMPVKDQAATTSTMALLRSLSGAIGISLAGAIFNSKATSLLSEIPGYTPPENPSSNVAGLKDIQPPSTAQAVIHDYGQAMNLLWVICAPLTAVGFLAALGVKGYSMQRNNVNAADVGKDKKAAAHGSSSDEEKATATVATASTAEEGSSREPSPARVEEGQSRSDNQ